MPTIKRKLNIGVIGLGRRSGLAWLAHNPKDGVQVVAGADINPQALAYCKKQHGPGLRLFTDYKKLLAQPDIDAVFITSPDFLHEDHAVAALAARKAVYLEKPMAITVKGCDRILEAAYKYKTRLYLGHNMRHMDFVLKMKELIDQGAIGQVKVAWCRHFVGYGGDAYFKDWHAERKLSTGLLLQKGAHDIDVLHWLCGGYARRVQALGGLTLYHRIKDRHKRTEPGDATFRREHWPPLSLKGLNPVIDVEDVSMMNMELDNGVLASYQQCHYTPDSWRNYTIIGTAGRIENFGDYSSDCIIKLWNSRKQDYNPDGDRQFVIQLGAGGHGGGDLNIVPDFVRFVREGGLINPTPIDARYSVAAGYMATLSLRQGGRPKDVPAVSDKIRNYFEHGQKSNR